MLANASIQNTTTLQGLLLCAAFNGLRAYVGPSSCPHGWIPAFAGMTGVAGVAYALNFLIASTLTGVKKLIKLPSGSRNSNERFPQGWVVGRWTNSPNETPSTTTNCFVYVDKEYEKLEKVIRACPHLSQASAQTSCNPARKLRAVFS